MNISMKVIKIYKKNESTLLIEASDIILREIKNYFSIYATNYQFTPLYKEKIWDGKIKFFNSIDNSLPIGLLEKVYEFASIGNYQVEKHFEQENKISRDEFIKFIKYLKLPFECRDYQFEAAYQACCKKHINIHISTSGGKSLVAYIICRFMETQNLQTLLIVPNIGLVEQIYSDFENYGWDVEYKCHKLYSGQRKVFERQVIIACWQSIYKNKDLFKQFGCLLIDEAHGASAKSISVISKNCINAKYRFGMSGTYPDSSSADWFSIVGSIGPIKKFATYKSLQEDGFISQMKIYNLILQYDNKTKLDFYFNGKKDYQKESTLINKFNNRNEFILKLAQKTEGNTLILFTKKETHGYILKDLFEKKLQNKTLLYIDGDVNVKEREKYRKMISERNDIILLATYGTTSTGMNAPNIHNIIFASSYKSKVKVLQSIGRMLRLSDNKEFAKLYDIIDDTSFSNKERKITYKNHAMKHFKERLTYYNEQDWNYKTMKFKL